MEVTVWSLRVLFCPTHYVYDDSQEGSEVAWAYNIADRIGSAFPSSVVVTGRSTSGPRRYRIVELTPQRKRLDLSLLHAFFFNARYTLAAVRALKQGHFDVVHHVLPFAIGRTYNLAALRHGCDTPFVIGPVQPPLGVPDTDVDPTDVRNYAARRPTHVVSLPRRTARGVEALTADVIGRLALSRLSRMTLRSAAAVVAVNDEARTLVIRRGVPPPRVVVIPPGVDTKRFQPVETPRTRPGGIDLLSVCHLIRRKNVDVIIRAFANLVEAAPAAKLRIVGDGPEREALTRQVYALGVHQSVTFAGSIPHAEIHEQYQWADAFVNASAAEGFSSTCLEALASGVPVVSTRVGGFIDAVEDERNGFLLGAADPNELATTLRRLVDNSALIRKLSRGARGLAMRRFDWDTSIIPKYHDLYERLIRERALPHETRLRH